MGRARSVTLLLLATACVVGCEDRPKRPKRKFDYGHFVFDEAPKASAEEVEVEEPEPSLHGYVYAKARFVWIRKKPTEESDWLGYITLGQQLAIRRDPQGKVDGTGTTCQTWIPVEPKGWVCVGRDATLDGDDPVYRILRERTANLSSAWPFDYARSLGAPRYRTLPNARDQKAKEGNIPALLEKIEKAKLAQGDAAIAAIDKRLVGVELGLTGEGPPPPFEPPHPVMETDEDIQLGSTIAYTSEFDHDGRAWLLGWDFAIIPQVRVKKYPRSAFRGVELSGDVELPLGFVKKQGAYKYRLDGNGEPLLTSEQFEPHAMVELAEGHIEADGRKLLETEEKGVYVSELDMVVVNPTGKIPKGVSDEGRRTWIEVSTVGGWLVAYEGSRPVFATAISAGKAATGADGRMVPSSSTPTGTWTIKNKLRTATMRSDRNPDRIHSEVMYTQVFHEDYALHGAYWHDDWGDRRSAGCVNLSPIDSKWLFDWTEPQVPREWHAKRVLSDEPTTIVVVHF